MDEPGPRLRAGVHYPRSTGEFQSWFATDADCLDYLDWLRWPGGFACPECGHGGGWAVPEPADAARHDRNPGGHRLTHDEGRAVAARGHGPDVEPGDQGGGVVAGAQKAHALREQSEVARQRLQLPAEPPVADDDEAGLGDDASDERGGAQEYVGAFLRGEPPGEADDRGPLAVWLGDVRAERQSGDRGQHLDAGGRHAVTIDEHVSYGGRRRDDVARPAA